MSSEKIRSLYLEFFKEKGHVIVPSSSIMPENDPTTLFTSAGMQQMIPYLSGNKNPLGNKIVDSQKCFRSQDIEEVGDNRHTTFFEMLGNWSFGDYFKEKQIPWIFEFLIKKVGLNPENIYVSVYRGNPEINIPRDEESVKLWKENFALVGIEAKDIDSAEINGMQGGRIFYYGDKKNWWSRSGTPDKMPIGELGGPDSEVFWDFGEELKIHENSEFKNEHCHPNCDCGRFLEIGNNVFMEFIKTEKGFEYLPQKNVDFGGGLERIVAVSENKQDVFETDLFQPIIKKIEELSGFKYGDKSDADYIADGKQCWVDARKQFRVVADHIKAATFIMADDKKIGPSNTGQGYLIRRLIRRAIRYGKQLGISKELWLKDLAEKVKEIYGDVYPELGRNFQFVCDELDKEENQFEKTLEKGLKLIDKLIEKIDINNPEAGWRQELADEGFYGINSSEIKGKWFFDFYQTYGFPFEMLIGELNDRGISFDVKQVEIARKEFELEQKKHQELSRTASAGMFKGGLADASEITTKYHTATHLLLASLRKVLGDHVFQKGSNITAERMRFDFSHNEKMTEEQIKKVEDLINEQIKAGLPVKMEEMLLEEAKAKNAMGVFESKYGDKVKVYTIGDDNNPFSREICGGPHVSNTSEIGGIKIIKEESVSNGVRRIKAILSE